MIKRINKRQKKLGNTTKLLVIRLVRRRKNYYDIVLSRKRAKPTSRLMRFGYYQITKNERENYSTLTIDHQKMKAAIMTGAHLHSSFTKLLIN